MSAIDERGWTLWAEPVRGRSCAKCQMCCTLIPVELPTGQKVAGERCRHLCSRGCSIYSTRPEPCQWWSCRWLFDPMTADLRRPDQCGYVIDAMTDTILVNGEPLSVVQVWADPKRPDVHRDPALRQYLAAVAEQHGYPALIRWTQSDGMLLVPPRMNHTGEWLELVNNPVSAGEMATKLAAVGVANRFGG